MKLPNGQKLTLTTVKNTEPETGKTVMVWDGQLAGFGLAVKPGGGKSYIVRYKNRWGEPRQMVLGKANVLTPEEARKAALTAFKAVADGKDPLAEKQQARNAPTVKELSEDYITNHAKPKNRPVSVRADEAMLRDHILPKLGNKKVEAITEEDIRKVHRGMSNTPYRANRVLALLSAMMNFAINKRKLRSDNPAKGVERFHEEGRDRWLTDDEIKRLVTALDEHPNQSLANAIRLLLLTGSRWAEVLGAKWEEFDLERGIWTKPAKRTKQKRKEHLPLTAPAVSLLAEMKAEADDSSPYLFPSKYDPKKPVDNIYWFWSDVTKAAGLEDVRVHDLRHSYASHLVQSGLSLEIVGKLLGHSQVATTFRYAHHSDDVLRAASERFGNKFAAIAQGKTAEVVPLAAAG